MEAQKPETSQSSAQPVVAVAPMTVSTPERGKDFEFRVTAPARGEGLPVILFSHGFTQSCRAYAPLVDYWASQGFAVIQPDHLDSWRCGLAPTDPRAPDFWRYREEDLLLLLDRLDEIEQAASHIRGRIDRSKIAVAGHSWGAQTASTLLGATHPDPRDGSTVSMADDRVKAGVLLCIPGTGGENLSQLAKDYFPFMNPDFTGMTTPSLIIGGDKDQSPLSVRGPEWWREAYDLAPGGKALFTAFGAEHSLGGIHTYEAEQLPDYSRTRVAAIQRVTTAFLRHALNGDDGAWSEEHTAAQTESASEGRLECK
ncbi:alpha/beta hydrolase family protein [Acidimangrovimonas sediminis]|uniref:alpha/beta hydrolase family protein n=1 Tax=Acidimangrovimonas sediminis TaxID=2056283 RepID=UPI000C80F321|nr:alpha/beta hydrolase [Acidimangrovimonas sediminis]